MFQWDDIPNFPSPPYQPQTINVEAFGPVLPPTVVEEQFRATECTHQVTADPKQGETQEEASQDEYDYDLDAPAATQETDGAESNLNMTKKNKTVVDKVASFFKRRSSRLMSSPKKNYSESSRGKSKQDTGGGVIDLD